MTNFQQLQKSRRRVSRGDVFVMLLPDDEYLFGRVIDTEATVGPIENSLLVYVFRARSSAKELPDHGRLKPSELLVPPMVTNRRGWVDGYFETVGSYPVVEGDVLERHVFRDSITGRFFNERSEEVPGPDGDVEDFGLHSYRTIDDAVSAALGVPLAPDC